MVYGGSRTVSEFLKYAAKKRKFQVIVAESAPGYDGQQMALTLAQAGIETTLITDSAIFAMMARVNKVILTCHAVLANGGLLVKSGSFAVAAAAKHHSTPVVVLTGLFKLSPVHAFDQDTFNNLCSPHRILEYQDGENLHFILFFFFFFFLFSFFFFLFLSRFCCLTFFPLHCYS